MRPVRIHRVLPAALALASACTGAVHQGNVERIAGVERARSFASQTAYEAYLRAELAVDHGNPAAAARQIELAQLGDPSDAFLAARRAEILLAAGQIDDALDAARSATRRFPENAATWIALAEVDQSRNDRDGAAVAFTHALADAPDDPDVRAAVARGQGASNAAIAHAIETSPGANAGDHTVAQRMLLDPAHDDRPTLRTLRRAHARAAEARHAWSEVDALLTPLVTADATDVVDRVRVIEARANDGRTRDAARLVPGVSVLPTEHGVRPAVRARLWLLASRADLAREEAGRALQLDANDALASLVFGEALIALGEVAHGVRVLADVTPEVSEFIDARRAAARALALAGRGAEAELSLARAIPRLAAGANAQRDALRAEWATLLLRRGAVNDARDVLAHMESAGGRHARAALLAAVVPPPDVLADLRVRSGDAYDDAVADAWIALLCTQPGAHCADTEAASALVAAERGATRAPETLRAEAMATHDRRAATDLVREAALQDPLSPWNGVISQQLGHR